MDNLDIKEFFKYLLKRIKFALILFIAVILAGNIYMLWFQKPQYQSYSTVILSSDDNSNQQITQTEVTLNRSLVDSYTQVIKSRKVLDQVNSKIRYGYSYEELSGKISVSSLNKTEIIKITATDSEPFRAKEIADATAKFFISEVKTYYNVNNVNILDAAIENSTPSNIKPVKQELIYIAVGILVSMAIIFVIFCLDRSVKTAEQVEQYTKLPVLGKIRRIQETTNELIVKNDPKSNISEDIRTLRTNLQFILNSDATKVALITSSIPHEGKSFISSNLATALAEAGKKTLLIDGDMRLGRVHEIFKVPNSQGLSNMLAEHKTMGFFNYIFQTNVHNLNVIPRGIVPPNPSELLDSVDMKHLLSYLRDQYDYIIIDGTPVANLPDSLIMAKEVDRTIITCSSNFTEIDDLQNAAKALANINANVSGVILNRVNVKRGKKYGKYGDYYYSYSNKK